MRENMKYKTYRIIDEKPRWVIIDENGKIINRNPSNEELKDLRIENCNSRFKDGHYNQTNTCDICKTDLHGKAYKEKNNEYEEHWTGKWICKNCYTNITRFGTADEDKLKSLRKNVMDGNYNEKNVCDACKENSLEPGKALKEYDKNGNFTGRYLCKNCYYYNSTYGTTDFDEIRHIQSIYESNKIKIPKKYNETNACEKIKDDGSVCGEKLIPGKTNKEYDKKGNWTGKWVCNKCYMRYDYHKRIDTHHNIVKSLANRRTGNINPNTNSYIGDIFENITCKVHNIKNLNIENDNYHSPIDHSPDPKLGILQTKGSIYNAFLERWHNGGIENEHNKVFDYLLFYCMSADMKIIERMYLFPKSEIIVRKSITIIKNPSKGGWYEKYRIDEKSYNDAYQEMVR